MKRHPIDADAALAEGVDYLLREFGGLARKGGVSGSGTEPYVFEGPIETAYLVASADARQEIRAVADFVCDGVDDHGEIQAALDLLGSPGGTVVLTEGWFKCTEALNVPYGATLQGQGMRTTGLWFDYGLGTAADGLLYGGPFEISDLEITFSNDGAGHCPRVIYTSQVWMDSVYIDAYGGTAGELTCAVETTSVYGNTRITNTTISAEGSGIIMRGRASMIDNCNIVCFQGGTEIGIQVLGSGSYYNTVSNCRVHCDGDCGIEMYNSLYSRVIGNFVYLDYSGSRASGSAAMRTWSSFSTYSNNVIFGGESGIDLGAGSHVVCANNMIEDAGPATDNGKAAIYGSQQNYGVVADNIIRQSWSWAISLEDCYEMAVTGNQIDDPTVGGIRIHDSDTIVVSGNSLDLGYNSLGLRIEVTDAGQSKMVNVVGNRFDVASPHVFIIEATGTVEKINRLMIANNTFHWSQALTNGYCQLFDAPHAQVTGNMFNGTSLKVTDCPGIVLDGNQFIDGESLVPSHQGTLVVDGCDDAQVANNQFTGPAFDSGDACIELTGVMAYPFVHGNKYAGPTTGGTATYRDYGLILGQFISDTLIGLNDWRRCAESEVSQGVLSEAVGVTDSVSYRGDLRISIVDEVDAADSTTIGQSHGRTITDAAAVTDSTDVGQGHTREITDASGVVDSVGTVET